MNETEQFEAWFGKHNLVAGRSGTCTFTLDDAGEYMDCDVFLAYRVWKACAESKQAELDKANARIAQLDEALKVAIIQSQFDMYMTGEELRLCEQAISGSSDTWLAEHDKAVEVNVLEDVLLKMDDVSIHSRQSFKLVQNLIKARK